MLFLILWIADRVSKMYIVYAKAVLKGKRNIEDIQDEKFKEEVEWAIDMLKVENGISLLDDFTPKQLQKL